MKDKIHTALFLAIALTPFGTLLAIQVHNLLDPSTQEAPACVTQERN